MTKTTAPAKRLRETFIGLICIGLLATWPIASDPAAESRSPEDPTSTPIPCSQYERGMSLLNDPVNPPDFVRAAEFLSKAAYSNEARAQYALGTLYLRGWGVPRDAAAAYAWIALSTEPDDERAVRALAGLREGLPAETLQQGQVKQKELAGLLPKSRVRCSAAPIPGER